MPDMSGGSGVDFGILQHAAPPGPQMQIIQKPNYNLQNTQSILQGIQTGTDAAAKMQDMRNQRALLPGQLQAQKLGNQGQSLLNQQNQVKLQADTQNYSDIQAQRQASQTGGLAAYTTALQQQGRWTEVTALQHNMVANQTAILDNKKSLSDLNATQLKNNFAQQSQVGETVGGILTSYPGNTQMQQQAWEQQGKPALIAAGIDPKFILPGSKGQWNEQAAVVAVHTTMSLNQYVQNNPYALAKLQPKANQTQTQQEVQQAKEMQFGITKTQIGAQVQSNAKTINDSQTIADSAAGMQTDVKIASNAIDGVAKWNEANPTDKIVPGPGFKISTNAKKYLQTFGVNSEDPAVQEIFQGKMDKLEADVAEGLKTVPRSPEVLKVFTNAAPKTDTSLGAMKARVMNLQYNTASAQTYVDYKRAYLQEHPDGIGLNSAWRNFQNDDPALAQGKLPDGSWLTLDNAQPYINNYKYTAPKAPQNQQSQQTNFPAYNQWGSQNPGGSYLDYEMAKRGIKQ